MKKTLLAGCLALGLCAAAFTPAPVHADEISFGVNLGADDQAHFNFNGHHDQRIFEAAHALQHAKHVLWNDHRHRGPAKQKAIMFINKALDQLSWIESNGY
ncbi:MAG TPA: hypothetical protein VK786_05110 [bacterium]|nr:hypothetical protein [bacterium]